MKFSIKDFFSKCGFGCVFYNLLTLKWYSFFWTSHDGWFNCATQHETIIHSLGLGLKLPWVLELIQPNRFYFLYFRVE